MKRGLIILAVVIVVGIGLFAGVGALIAGRTQPLDDAGNQFMTAVKNHDMNTAYGMFSAELSGQVSEGTFQDIVGDARVADWSFSGRSVENDTGKLTGNATIDSKAYTLELDFVQRDGRWQLTEYDFNQ